VVDNGSRHVGEIASLLVQYGSQVTILTWDQLTGVGTRSFRFAVLSGGRGMTIEHHRVDLAPEMELVRNFGKPILGICLGFELIADVFGGKLNYHEERELGLASISITKQDPIFNGVEQFTAYMAHKWCLEKAPLELIELARSVSGVAVFRHQSKPIYGFQFHPEVQDPPNGGAQLLENFLQRVVAVRS